MFHYQKWSWWKHCKIMTIKRVKLRSFPCHLKIKWWKIVSWKEKLKSKKPHFLHRMDKLKAILVKVSHDSPKKESNKQKIITTRASIKRTAANRVMIKPHDQSEDTMCSLLMIIFATCIKTINIIICSLSQMSRS